MSPRNVAIATTIAVLSIVALLFVWPHSKPRVPFADAETSAVEQTTTIEPTATMPTPTPTPPSPSPVTPAPPKERKTISHAHRTPPASSTARGPMVDLRQ